MYNADVQAFIKELQKLTGIETVVTRLRQTVGQDDVIIVLPTAQEQNAFVDDGLQEWNEPLFPEWHDISVSVLTSELLPKKSYFPSGYHYSNLKRQFAGTKIAVTYDVAFDNPQELAGEVEE